MANSKKRKKLFLFSTIGLVLVVLTLAAVFKKKDSAITIQTEKVALRSITEIVVANGKVQPVKQVVISPEVAGEIVDLPVKEGDRVKKGDLLVQIKPDNYIATSNSAVASYKSALASRGLALAELSKAEAEYKRNDELFLNHLVSDSVYFEFKTAFEVAKLRYTNSVHQIDQARFALDKASDDLSKTTIVSPMDGTVTRLQSQKGERVLGTSFNKGTEIMTIADLKEMEARVDIGETDVVRISPGQIARLDVDAFKDRKFGGLVTDVANSAKGLGSSSMNMGGGGGGGGSSQDATKFEVHIRIKDTENFLPGMSVTAEIETCYRTNVLTVPIASLTTRLPKDDKKNGTGQNGQTNSPAANASAAGSDKKNKEAKPIVVVFVVDGDHVKSVPVKSGISDADYSEITDGLKEGDEVVSGGFRAINRDLDDGHKIVKGPATPTTDKKEL